MLRRNGLTFFCVLLAALPLGAGDETRKFSGEASVNVIEVPVRVFDPKTGDAIIGLTPGDFLILENGIPQEISNFSELGGADFRAPEMTDQPAAQRALQTRQVIYFLDLYLMKGLERDRALEGLRAAHSTGFDGTEEVSIVTFDGTLRTHLDRSRDRRRFGRAIEEVADLRARGLDQAVSFTSALSDGPVSGERDLNYYERRQRNQEFVAELDRRVQRVGDAISVTMSRFDRAEGRKALVVFTPGQPDTNWAPSYRPVDFLYGDVEYPSQELWRGVALEASDLGFTLFVVDTSGLGSQNPGEATEGVDTRNLAIGELSGSAAEPNSRDRAAIQTATLDIFGEEAIQPANLGQWLERTRKRTLIAAADLSGGQAYFTANAAVAIESVDQDLQHWYSLAYVVEHGGDGQEYTIEVSLPKMSHVKLQHRQSYVDRPPSQREAERMRSAMLFGGDANPLGIRVEVGDSDSRFRLGAVGSKRVQVPFVVKIPIGRIDMVPRGDVYWGKVLITFFGNDEHGNQSRIASQEQPIVVAAEEFHRAASSGYFTYKITVEVEGGDQTVFVGVKDEISGKLSISRQEFSF